MITEKSKSKLLAKFIILIVLTVTTVFIALVLFGCYAMASTINLPRTGQTICYDKNGDKIACAGTGQDGDVKAGVVWPNPRFTENGDRTITDKLTGLVWAKNAGTPTVGLCRGGVMAWKKALKYVACLNAAKYLGHGDWRLPNINELESLVNAGQSNPGQWLGTQGFTDVQPYRYWSSTTHFSLVPSDAWFVFMWDGTVYYNGKSNSDNSYVWPVRAGQSGAFDNAAVWKTGQIKSYYRGDDGDIRAGTAWPNPRFIDHGDGTVTDNLTGLMWTKDANPAGEKTWQQALDYVASMNAAAGGSGTYGHNDWRLPNIKELRSREEYSEKNVLLLAKNPWAKYWSSTTVAGLPAIARAFYMLEGYMTGFGKSNENDVWPVRAGRVGNSITPASSVGSTCPSGSEGKALSVTDTIWRLWKWLKGKLMIPHSGTGRTCGTNKDKKPQK